MKFKFKSKLNVFLSLSPGAVNQTIKDEATAPENAENAGTGGRNRNEFKNQNEIRNENGTK